MCNFGDASSNHSTAQGAINAAAWAAFQSVPMPIVFICEDISSFHTFLDTNIFSLCIC